MRGLPGLCPSIERSDLPLAANTQGAPQVMLSLSKVASAFSRSSLRVVPFAASKMGEWGSAAAQVARARTGGGLLAARGDAPSCRKLHSHSAGGKRAPCAARSCACCSTALLRRTCWPPGSDCEARLRQQRPASQVFAAAAPATRVVGAAPSRAWPRPSKAHVFLRAQLGARPCTPALGPGRSRWPTRW